MIKLRPDWLPKSTAVQGVPSNMGNPGFVCHPSTSELAEQLLIDPQSLSDENYSGLYDENGDYVPQYCDDPEKIPRSMSIEANKDSTPVGTEATAGPQEPEVKPAIETPKTSESE